MKLCTVLTSYSTNASKLKPKQGKRYAIRALDTECTFGPTLERFGKPF